MYYLKSVSLTGFLKTQFLISLGMLSVYVICFSVVGMYWEVKDRWNNSVLLRYRLLRRFCCKGYSKFELFNLVVKQVVYREGVFK